MERTIGWLLDESDRARLLLRFPPHWPDLVAHHVTLASQTDDPLRAETAGEIVGETDDGHSLQALVVAIGGSTRRPDGGSYHITWSLDRGAGREPRQSNDVLRTRGWVPVDPPVPVRLHLAELS